MLDDDIDAVLPGSGSGVGFIRRVTLEPPELL